MNSIKYLLILTAVVPVLKLSGQSDTRINEKEIKTTGKYFYSWAFENDIHTARESAKRGLLDTIFISILNEKSIDYTDTVFIREIDYFERKVGFKWQAIAFTEKKDIEFIVEKRKKLRVIPIIVGDTPIATPANVYKSSDEFLTKEEFKNSVESASPKQQIITGNEILDGLIALPDASSLEKKLIEYSGNLKLNYGAKKNYPDDSGCYVFIIDQKTHNLKAVFDKGTGIRRNFLTGLSDQNIYENYRGDYFVYVVIN